MTPKTDEDEVAFEVSMKTNGTLWTVSITCKSGLTDQEFAAALICLSDDISEGKVNFDEARSLDGH